MDSSVTATKSQAVASSDLTDVEAKLELSIELILGHRTLQHLET